MNRTEVKSHKERLRLIEDHLRNAHDILGVERDPVGFAEVVHHTTYMLPALNYVTPRRKMALVPGKHIENGIETLREYRRTVRVLYIEELFPEFFGDMLEKIGLTLQNRFPLSVIDLTAQDMSFALPAKLSITTVSNQQGLDIWSIIWRDARYKVFATPLEPLQIGQHHQHRENILDVIVYHHDTAVAVARMTFYENKAHLMARALLQSTQPLRLHQWLIQACVQTAQEQDCDMLFVCDDMQPVLSSANVSCQLEGSMLCYTELVDDAHGEEPYEEVEQPVLLT